MSHAGLRQTTVRNPMIAIATVRPSVNDFSTPTVLGNKIITEDLFDAKLTKWHRT